LNNLFYTLEERFFCYKPLPTTRIAGGLLWKILRFRSVFSTGSRAVTKKRRRNASVMQGLAINW
ncbi:MAG: hypothetical protein SPJ89_06450, partial [Treponema sp.]|nr:hypothetical protein [Treponema sp.]